MATKTEITKKKPDALTSVKKSIRLFVNSNLPGNSACQYCQIRISLVASLEQSVVENAMIHYLLERIRECRNYFRKRCKFCKQGLRKYETLVLNTLQYQSQQSRGVKREYGEEVEETARSMKKTKLTE